MYKLTHREYFEALKENRLLGLKCNDCGEYTAPPKVCCDHCSGMNLEVAGLSGEGEIKTYTVTRVAPRGLEAPYIVAMVELKEGPWIMGTVDNMDPDQTGIELIGRKVTVGHRVIAEMEFAGEEGVTPVFYVK